MIRSDLLPLAFSFSLVSLRFSFVSVLIISMKNAEAVRHPPNLTQWLARRDGFLPSCLLLLSLPCQALSESTLSHSQLMFFVSRHLGLKTLSPSQSTVSYLSVSVSAFFAFQLLRRTRPTRWFFGRKPNLYEEHVWHTCRSQGQNRRSSSFPRRWPHTNLPHLWKESDESVLLTYCYLALAKVLQTCRNQ